MGGLRFEAWTLPWSASYVRVIADIPVIAGTGTGNRRFNDFGKGKLRVPDDWDRLDELVTATAGRLVRVFDGTTVVHEWIAERVDFVNDDDGIAEVSGDDIASVLDRAIVYPWDYPANPTIIPNWTWGGNDVLRNGTFETDSFPNGGFELGNTDYWQGLPNDAVFNGGGITAALDNPNARSGDWYGIADIDGSAGPRGVHRGISGLVVGETYTITGYLNEDTASGERYRAGIDAGSASHANAYLEGDYWYAEVDNVASPNGASDGTWQSFTLTFVANNESSTLVIVGEDATPLDFWLDDWTITGDNVGITPWFTRGIVNVFKRQTTTVHSGSAAIELQVTDYDDGDGNYVNSGIVQGRDLVVGQTYQASIWVYQASGADEDFLWAAQRRTPKGKPGTPGSSFIWSVTTTVSTATWTELAFSFVADVTDVDMHFRWVGSVGDTSSPTFFVDDATLTAGLAETTLGAILIALLDDATTDHSGDTRGTILGWIDYTGFDATNDSTTTAWDDATLSYRVPRGKTYGQVFDDVRRLGYEWTLTPKASPGATTHDLNVYNNGATGTDYSSGVATPSINAGQLVNDGKVVKRIPRYTAVLVEGSAQTYTEDVDSTAETNFGRLERYRSDRALTGSAARVAQAATMLEYESENRAAVKVKVHRSDTVPVPLVEYAPGDTLNFQIPPNLAKEARRIQTISYRNTEPVEYDVTGSQLFDDASGMAEAMRLVLRKFAELEDLDTPIETRGGDGGRTPTLLVAAVDSDLGVKEAADFICPGVADQTVIQAAHDAIENGPGIGRLVLAEGNYTLTVAVELAAGISVVGMGRRATIVKQTGANEYCFESSADGCSVSDLEVTGAGITRHGIWMQHDKCGVHNVTVSAVGGGLGNGVFFDGTGNSADQCVATNIWCEGANSGLSANNADDLIISGVHFSACNIGLILTSVDNAQVTGLVVDTPAASHGLRMTSCSESFVRGVIHNGGAFSSPAVSIDGGARNTVDVTVSNTNWHAVELKGSTADNLVRVLADFPTTGTDDTYDVVNVPSNGNVDRNMIYAIGRRGDATHRWRYGFAIESTGGSGSADNRVITDLEDIGTGDVLDNGTTTMVGPGGHEWNLGVPSGRTTDDVMVWDGSQFVLQNLALGGLSLDQASTTGAVPVLTLDQADVDEDYFKFIGTSDTSADRALVDAANFTTPGAIVGWLKINVQDDQGTAPITDGDYYIPFYAVPTA